MDVIINPPVSIGAAGWKITWTGAGPFYIYIKGKLYLFTTAKELIVADPGNIEILESAAPKKVLTGSVELFWKAGTNINYYSVEQYIGAVWTEVARIKDNGEACFIYDSEILADVTTPQFRVKATDANGNTSSGTTLNAIIVRHPDVPDVVYTFSNSTKKITISAAT